jgi:hypothetical protein
VKTATVTKANDMPEGPLFSFKGEVHEFGKDADGDPITVNIISAERVEVQAANGRATKWPAGLCLVRDVIAAAIEEAGIPHRVRRDGPLVRGVDIKRARAVHNQRYVSSGEGDRNEAERKAWARNLKDARSRSLIGGELNNGTEVIWLVSTTG